MDSVRVLAFVCWREQRAHRELHFTDGHLAILRRGGLVEVLPGDELALCLACEVVLTPRVVILQAAGGRESTDGSAPMAQR